MAVSHECIAAQVVEQFPQANVCPFLTFAALRNNGEVPVQEQAIADKCTMFKVGTAISYNVEVPCPVAMLALAQQIDERRPANA